jgi:hypothetical protein
MAKISKKKKKAMKKLYQAIAITIIGAFLLGLALGWAIWGPT